MFKNKIIMNFFYLFAHKQMHWKEIFWSNCIKLELFFLEFLANVLVYFKNKPSSEKNNVSSCNRDISYSFIIHMLIENK